jgi:lipopolysaccharide/colanic/teichoic acid biosynthesis glycosyltransferase
LKRLFDIVFSAASLLVFAPFLAVLALIVRTHDGGPALYRARRLGREARPFTLLKFRSMVVDADKIPIDTTSDNDPRLTPIGRIIRRGKLDELPQFWNVLRGDMSIVGPRPQVPREVALYTPVEHELLSVRPGITDLSSIVFADLEQIVKDHPDPDIAYNQLVRPWKSRLGLLYIEKRHFGMDIAIIVLTVWNAISRRAALDAVGRILTAHEAPPELVAAAARRTPLVPTPPPGSDDVVRTRVVLT